MSELIITTGDVTTERTETNPALVYLAGLKASGRRTMRGTLDRVADLAGGFDLQTMPWAELRYEHVVALRTKLQEDLAPATVNKYLSAIRGVLRAAWRMDQIPGDAYQKAIDIDGVTVTICYAECRQEKSPVL